MQTATALIEHGEDDRHWCGAKMDERSLTYLAGNLLTFLHEHDQDAHRELVWRLQKHLLGLGTKGPAYWQGVLSQHMIMADVPPEVNTVHAAFAV